MDLDVLAVDLELNRERSRSDLTSAEIQVHQLRQRLRVDLGDGLAGGLDGADGLRAGGLGNVDDDASLATFASAPAMADASTA